MRVLISRPDKIGDVVLALHGVKQLKQRKPEIQVFIHAAGYTRALLQNITFIDGVVGIDEDITPYAFDAVVDLMAKNETARLYTESPIKVRIGNSARWFRFRYNKTRYIRRSHALMNEAEYNWQLISLLDDSLKYIPLTSALDTSDFKVITPYLELTNYVTLMPGVSVSAMGWPVKHWQDLARGIVSKGKNVLIILGPAERDIKEDFDKLTCDPAIQVRMFDTFPEVLGALQGAEQFVGPSTGITHLASSLGIQGVALYPEDRSMHPRRWMPFKSSLSVLSLTRQVLPEHVLSALFGTYPEAFNPMPRATVSAFVVCCNEERNIRRCLDSIAWCDEIIVVDSGSTDKTLDIVSEYTDKIYHRQWTGHSEQKQFALDHCTKEWVVNIDSDEEVSTELKAQLLRILSLPEAKRNAIPGYVICRMVYFLDRWWDRGGWFPEYRMRFFLRKNTRWGGVNPHEKAIVKGKCRKLSEPIFHYTYRDFGHQIDTLNKHSSLSAECLYRDGKRCHLHNFVLNPLFRFFKFYILKSGFREGVPGLIVAGIEASYTFFKYIKLWELQRKEEQDALLTEKTENKEAFETRQAA